MEPTDAAAGTSKALQAALEAAQREREALSERLQTVDQLIEDLSGTLTDTDDRARTPTTRSRRAPGAKKSTRKATRKRGGKKASAKRAGKQTARKGATTKKATRKATRKKSTAKKGAAKKAARQRQEPGRTDRVVQIVNQADRPLSTGDVRSQLANREPDVSSKLVSAALSYAERKGRIRKQNGRWVGASS